MNCPINGKPCTKHKGFHVTDKHDGKVETYQVCEDCLYLDTTKKIGSPVAEVTCESCGVTLNEIIKGGRVGCAQCYTKFGESMAGVIAAVQASTSETQHKGRTPYLWRLEQAEQTSPVSFATELSQKVRLAKRNEEYKSAAKYKKSLDAFQEKLSEYHEADERRAPALRKELADFIFEYRESELAEGF